MMQSLRQQRALWHLVNQVSRGHGSESPFSLGLLSLGLVW